MTADKVGYGKPPAAGRFVKGKSGNPKGRPRRSAETHVPYEAVLGRMVTVREDGETRRMTAAEAFLLHIAKAGLEGDGAAARVAMAAIEKARAVRGLAEPATMEVLFRSTTKGRVNGAMEALGMAKKLHRGTERSRMVLERWVVRRALERLGDRRLTRAEQAAVMEVVLRPKRMQWPEWWEVGVGDDEPGLSPHSAES